MDQEEIDRSNLNHAAEAFEKFVRWSRKQAKYSGAVLPVLMLFDDGSGHIEHANTHEQLEFNGCTGFSSLADLAEKLSNK